MLNCNWLKINGNWNLTVMINWLSSQRRIWVTKMVIIPSDRVTRWTTVYSTSRIFVIQPRRNGGTNTDDYFKHSFVNQVILPVFALKSVHWMWLARSYNWFNLSFGTEQATSLNLNQWRPSSAMHVCGTIGGDEWNRIVSPLFPLSPYDSK